MNRRRFLAGLTLGVAGAGCLDETTAGEGAAATGGNVTGEDCPRETIEVYPIVEIPDERTAVDPAWTGLSTVDPIADALADAHSNDNESLRGALNAETQFDEENKLATVRVPEQHSETVHERLGAVTYVTYEGQEYALVFVYTAC